MADAPLAPELGDARASCISAPSPTCTAATVETTRASGRRSSVTCCTRSSTTTTDAGARLERHDMQMRAAGTTYDRRADVVPPTWLFEEFAIIAHGARPWADTIRRVGITDANPVNIGIQQSPGAVVGVQSPENTAPADGNFNATVLTTSPKTYTGKTDVSRQLVDGSNPAVDGIIYAGGDAWAPTTSRSSRRWSRRSRKRTSCAPRRSSSLARPAASIRTPPGRVRRRRRIDPQAPQAAPPRVGRVLLLKGRGRSSPRRKRTPPGGRFVITGYHGPMNAYGLGEAVVYGQVAGEVVGLSVVPTWAQAADNHLFVAKADDLLLLESSTFNFRYDEVLGPESIRLGVWGYAAPVVGRYAMAIAKIDAGVTIPAPQMDEGPGALEAGDDNGPRARK